jgi:MtrB/PioB family decaheme-associated outer membrane protein
MNLITTRRRWLAVMLCLPLPMYAASVTAEQDVPAGVDISRWDCEYCVFEQGTSGDVEAGAGYVSDDSYKFGEYNGLNKEGAYPIGGIMARYRDEDGKYVDLTGRNLGLDNRSVDIEGGLQGKYKLFLKYDELPHYISDSAQTPYRGNGDTHLNLPPGWTTAGSTAGMTQLVPDLRGVNLQTERKRLGLGLSFIPASKWGTALSFRHEVRDGQKATAGSFFFNSAQLVEPVDYVTDELEASATYTTGKWQSKLSYYGSFFNDRDTSLTWQNAYNPLVPGATAGQRALPPDNQFHQVQLSSAYRLTESTRISGDVAVGRMEQDEDLLAATINPNISVTLPRTSANAKVDTLTADLKVDSAVNKKLRLNAALRYNDRDNKTPRDTFNWVTTDDFIAVPRSNLPYSFTDITGALGADYRISRITRLSGGYDYTKKERTHQEVNNTTEDTFWAKVSVQARENLDLAVKAAHADRSTSDYNPVAQITPAENPLMRKFNMADRERDTAGVQASFIPHERVSITVGVDYAQDDYTNSVLGLTGSQETDFNADTSVILTEATSLHLFGGRQLIKSKQVGSQTFSTPDWYAKNNDTYDSAGLGVKHQLIKNKLDVGADYVLTRSTGKIKVVTGAPNPDFPDLKTSLDSVKLYADYRLKENMTLHAAYWYEHYNSKSWAVDGVNPDTIPNVISFGEDSPDYNVHAVMLSLRYHF